MLKLFLKRLRDKRGITLILVAGVLTVLAALGAGFYSVTLSQSRSATRYNDAVRAEMLAHGGIQFAVGQLRKDLYERTEDPAALWYTADYLRGGKKTISYPASTVLNTPFSADNPPLPFTMALGSTAGKDSDRMILNIEDAASKININAGDNLAVILDNLCRAIGPPLVAADLDHLQPRRWAQEGASGAEYSPTYDGGVPENAKDTAERLDIYYRVDKDKRPITFTSGPNIGQAIYGDGYAIVAYRARNGKFRNIDEVKQALTYMKRPTRPDLEEFEREVKFQAIRPYLTIHSWVDTNTVCVGKFEWVAKKGSSDATMIAIDRDKSWVPSVDENGKPYDDPQNTRGSLRGCYVSIMNGHGAGQLRRILENGLDWIEVEHGFVVPPGPISSYMIVAKEDALLEEVQGNGKKTHLPQTKPDGTLVDDPNINYALRPLCIHRAPVNINTASDKVLTALFMGINVQHGHYMAVGTDADLEKTYESWVATNYYSRWPSLAGTKGIESYLLTFHGLKRIPATAGKLEFRMDRKIADILPDELMRAPFDFQYITNHGQMGLNEAHELAARVISARQRRNPLPVNYKPDQKLPPDPDPFTKDAAGKGFERGPFRSWDDFYFRVVKPWDDIRSYPEGDEVPNSGMPARSGKGKASLARMIMAHFNSNTAILKFNPNVEWIDRWGRNFTEMEPVLIYTNDPNNGKEGANVPPANPLTPDSVPIFARERNVAMPGYPWNPVTLADFWHWVVESNKADNKGDGAFIVRSQRYKADELIDKTDLNRSTTEFTFDSSGIFEIGSTGQVFHERQREVMAERKAEALVRVYDVWRESTQADFVRGEFSEAITQNTQGGGAVSTFGHSGRISRDGVHGVTQDIRRLAISSHPEPLVPLTYRLTQIGGGSNREEVDPSAQMRDAYGNLRVNPWDSAAPPEQVPDILANRVLPARYDGQLMLAVNTPKWDPQGDKDTFIANFIGDLDTTTSVYNGREQSKIPYTPGGDGYKYRVVDTIGLLGLLNDELVDVDPDLPIRKVYPFATTNEALGGLEIGDPGDPSKSYYYNNVSCRMGDLRPDGVFLGNAGVSGRDATIKYMVGDEAERGARQAPRTTSRHNYNPNAEEGVTITMWAKPTWHQDDFRRHEFFNCANPGVGAAARGNFMAKEGRYRFSGDARNGSFSNQGRLRNDFGFGLESNGVADGDHERYTAFFGGSAYVPRELLPDPDDPKFANDRSKHIESPGYYIQPFRWHFLGARFTTRRHQVRMQHTEVGHWRKTGANSEMTMKQMAGGVIRPVLNSAVMDEKDYSKSAELMWSTTWTAWGPEGTDIAAKGTVPQVNQGGGRVGMSAKWDWADPKGRSVDQKVFTINNLNNGKPANDAQKTVGMWHYRHMPDEGTYAVIDSFKISHRSGLYDWDGGEASIPKVSEEGLEKDRIYQETTLSRYYLPPNPGSRNEQPWFKSQTLARFLQGDTTAVSEEQVTVVRVTWSGFTPRFMHENKRHTGQYKRTEYVSKTMSAGGQKAANYTYRGPFDVKIYNDDEAVVDVGEDNGRQRRHASVARPLPDDYRGRTPKDQPHFSRGFEVELLRDTGSSGGSVLGNKTFEDPNAINVISEVDKPVRVSAKELRYRVRFKYPVDPLVDPVGGLEVDPSKHYLLDSPVFDDISVTYMSRVQFLSYKLINE